MLWGVLSAFGVSVFFWKKHEKHVCLQLLVKEKVVEHLNFQRNYKVQHLYFTQDMIVVQQNHENLFNKI